MSLYSRLSQRVDALVHRDARESELSEELQFHIEMATQANVERGLALHEARRRALLEFGGVDQIKESCRDSWGTRYAEDLLRDTRFALRSLLRNPAYTLVVVVTLALGIGANTAIFSVVNGVLLSPLPYSNADRIVMMSQDRPLAGAENIGFSVKELDDYRNADASLAAVVEYHSMDFTLLGGEKPERVRTGVVSDDYFDVVGVEPLLGRNFLPGEDEIGAEPVLLLSYDYWQATHGGDPGVVGRTFEMNDRIHTVVGVLPPLPRFPGKDDVYMPISSCPFRSSPQTIEGRDRRMLTAVALLAPGISTERAAADVSAIASRLKQDYPESYPASGGLSAGVSPLREELVRDARPTFLILLATVALVLLIACANVANLTLARLGTRQQELAVRTAMGAGRGRLMRQLLTESTMLSLAGAGLGLLIAYLGRDLLVSFATRFTPRAVDIQIDGAVLFFTLAIALVTGFVFGSIPSLPGAQRIAAALSEASGRSAGSQTQRRTRHALVVAQLSVSFVLLIGAALMLRSLVELHRLDPGFRTDRVLTGSVALDWSRYVSIEDVEERRLQMLQFYEPLLEEMAVLPGVEKAALSWTFPLNTTWRGDGSFQIEGRDLDPPPRADFRAASPDYFGVIGMPLLEGREFAARDRVGERPVVIVSQSTSKRHWGSESPLGRRISGDGGETWAEIVGVVGDARRYRLDEAPRDAIYSPFLANPGFGTTVLVRTSGDPLPLARGVESIVARLDPEVPLYRVRSFDDVRAEALASPVLTTMLLSLFATLALLITATGVGGVIAYSVSQRTHEIGIRMALGAEPRKVMSMLMRQGMTSVVVGLVLGGAAALAFSRVMSGLLYGVEPTDPYCFFGSAVVFVGVAAFACFLPSRRATAIDPMVALRTN